MLREKSSVSSFKASCVSGVGLNDSPAGLAAYIINMFSFVVNPSYKNRADSGLLERYTYDELIDNLMIYWVSNSFTTAIRIYAEQYTKSNVSLAQLLESYVTSSYHKLSQVAVREFCGIVFQLR